MWRIASVLILAAFSGAVSGESAMLSGSLGTWLDKTAAPELVEAFGKHPKFKGQRIKFVTLVNGNPANASNHLSRAIQQHLTHRILREGNNDVAWQNNNPTCPTVGVAPYLLGVEIIPLGRYRHRVRLAVLDTDEGVWVGGLSLSWEGRLLATEQSGLITRISTSPMGSVSNPVSMSDRARVVSLVKSQLNCTLRAGLDGMVQIIPSKSAPVQLFLRDLEQTLSLESKILVTQVADAATWQLEARLEPAGFGTRQLTINVAPLTEPISSQRIAAVYVTDAGTLSMQAQNMPAAGTKSGPAKSGQATPQQVQVPPPTQNRSDNVPSRRPDRSNRQQYVAQPASDLLLGEARLVSATPSTCTGYPESVCAEVALRLANSAYLLVFRTSESRVRPASCSQSQLRRERGEHRYRLAMPAHQHSSVSPDAGMYILASSNRMVIERIAGFVRRAPGACGKSQSTRARSAWLKDFLALVEQYAETLDWQALHFRVEADGIKVI